VLPRKGGGSAVNEHTHFSPCQSPLLPFLGERARRTLDGKLARNILARQGDVSRLFHGRALDRSFHRRLVLTLFLLLLVDVPHRIAEPSFIFITENHLYTSEKWLLPRRQQPKSLVFLVFP
jgi:hypothetical protein